MSDHTESPRPGNFHVFGLMAGEDVHVNMRRGTTLDALIEEFVNEYRQDYERWEGEDVSIWSGPRLVALIRSAGEGEARVERFDGPRPAPGPALTAEQRSILDHHSVIGHQESMERLFLQGAYGTIRDAINRLGGDAVAELSRIVRSGELPGREPIEAPVVPEIEAAHGRFARETKRARRLNRRKDELRQAYRACQKALRRCDKRRDEAETELIHAIVAADPRPDHSIEDWYYSTRTAWRVRSGSRVFALVPNGSGSMPGKTKAVHEVVSLAIVED